MLLIEQEPHFWELYQQQDQYYLSIAIDLSSVVCCWEIQLNSEEIASYQHQGRVSIETLAKQFVEESYRGNFSNLGNRQVTDRKKAAMQTAFKLWRENHH